MKSLCRKRVLTFFVSNIQVGGLLCRQREEKGKKVRLKNFHLNIFSRGSGSEIHEAIYVGLAFCDEACRGVKKTVKKSVTSFLDAPKAAREGPINLFVKRAYKSLIRLWLSQAKFHKFPFCRANTVIHRNAIFYYCIINAPYMTAQSVLHSV